MEQTQEEEVQRRKKPLEYTIYSILSHLRK